MTNTGIIRKLDDLGRIVIPKEIRHKLKINVGDNLEIHVDEEKGMVAYTRYKPNKTVRDAVKHLREVVWDYDDGLSESTSDKLLEMLSEMEELLKEEGK